MYIPAPFAERDPETLQELIRENSFGLLVSHGPDGPVATHLPFLLEPGGPHGLGRLVCHMARENPQWQALAGGARVLAVFGGPHAYVTPRWYARGGSVPTWNYVAVHAYGPAETVHDPDRLRGMVAALSAAHEAGRPDPWSPAEMKAAALTAMLKAIVGVEIPIDRLEGKRKLSQNRSVADRAGVIAGLDGQGDEASRALAAAMTGGQGAPGRRADFAR
jgi:transcriptional regulator